jgi:hypothetical protein
VPSCADGQIACTSATVSSSEALVVGIEWSRLESFVAHAGAVGLPLVRRVCEALAWQLLIAVGELRGQHDRARALARAFAG